VKFEVLDLFRAVRAGHAPQPALDFFVSFLSHCSGLDWDYEVKLHIALQVGNIPELVNNKDT
jgi:hypothetical protein